MTSFAIGDKISFSYLKGANKEGLSPTLVDYASRAENYEGTVEDVRNIAASPLSRQTISYGQIKGERSENLVTVETDDGPKCFYDGRMVNAQKVEEGQTSDTSKGEAIIEKLLNQLEKLNDKLTP